MESGGIPFRGAAPAEAQKIASLDKNRKFVDSESMAVYMNVIKIRSILFNTLFFFFFFFCAALVWPRPPPAAPASGVKPAGRNMESRPADTFNSKTL